MSRNINSYLCYIKMYLQFNLYGYLALGQVFLLKSAFSNLELRGNSAHVIKYVVILECEI